MSDSEPTVTLQCTGNRADVILSRPAARNALNLQMCNELINTFEKIATNPEIAVVVLKSLGPVFCAGADRKERHGHDEAWIMARRRTSFRAYEMIGACAVPVVCIVQGPLVGSGGEIAMSCDFIIASSEATFRFPEPQLGTVGATQRLQRSIGVSRAKELIYTGRNVGAEEALSLGLIARICSPEQLERESEAVITRILEAPPLAMRLTKQCIDQGSRSDLHSGIAIELSAIERNLQQHDGPGISTRSAADIGSEKNERQDS